VKEGDEIYVWRGRYTGMFGRIRKCWQTSVVVYFNNECRRSGDPKAARFDYSEVRPPSAVDLLARLAS